MAILLITLIFVVLIIVKLWCPKDMSSGVWGCGYTSPNNRMQYTASSFAQMIIAMFAIVLRPQIHYPEIKELFPRDVKMHSHVDDIILDLVLIPIGLMFTRWFTWCRRFQQGVTQHYIFYILLAMMLLMCSLINFEEFALELFGA